MSRIWIVEDDAKFRLNLKLDLEEASHVVDAFSNARQVLNGLEDLRPPDLMLLDVRMPGMTGVELVTKLSEEKRLPPTIVISGEASISETVAALSCGVHDFIEKPFTRERLTRSIKNCLDYQALAKQVRDLQKGKEPAILGESPPIRNMLATLERIARTEGRVLILGESGTGKELVANYLHTFSQRSAGPFIKINCAAVPIALIEGELFGHVRGAFTGASEDKRGLFEEAHGGTFFLDEIGEMDIGLQTRLLRVLEDGRVRRLGGHRERQVDVRVIAATNRDLKAQIEKGLFREDLYFRLNILPVLVPPLRDRREDIALLTAFFIDRFCRANRMRHKGIRSEVIDILRAYAWPGNVRELRNLCERLVILGNDPIEVSDLPSDLLVGEPATETGLIRLPAPQGKLSLKKFKHQCEKEFIESTLRRNNWDYVQTAAQLDIQRTYLHRKITQLNIRRPERSGQGANEE